MASKAHSFLKSKILYSNFNIKLDTYITLTNNSSEFKLLGRIFDNSREKQ